LDKKLPITTVIDSNCVNFRIEKDSNVVANGKLLPNNHDDIVGKAPDLGAVEAGKDEPIYGPRPRH
jgi:hypothetical protein